MMKEEQTGAISAVCIYMQVIVGGKNVYACKRFSKRSRYSKFM